jgi:hypothetical protein
MLHYFPVTRFSIVNKIALSIFVNFLNSSSHLSPGF